MTSQVIAPTSPPRHDAATDRRKDPMNGIDLARLAVGHMIGLWFATAYPFKG